jgi:hypothetical protein
MKPFVHLLPLVAVLVVAGIPLATQAQTPLPAPAPGLSMRWLASLLVDPRLIARDGLQSVTAAVKLTQRAASTMEVRLELAGGTPMRGNPGMQRVECVWTYRSIYLAQGARSESFPIYTSTLQPRAGTPPATVPKTITIAARYGSERVSATFTVNCPQ